MKEFIKSIMKWVGTDGLLHFLVCFAMMLMFTPIVGIWWALGVTVLAAALKEIWDFFIQKDNNFKQVMHDVVCDGVGMVTAYLTILLWWLCNV